MNMPTFTNRQLHCKYIDSFCRKGYSTDMVPDCCHCIIKIAYDNGFDKGLHRMESWDRCPGMTAN